MPNYKPLHDNILVKILKPEVKTSSGILLPTSEKERSFMGEVIAVGFGKVLDNGNKKPLTLKIGDKIIFKSYSVTEVPTESELVVLNENDVLLVVEN